VERLVELTCRPVVAELAARGHPFVGVLFAGLMLTAEGPKVLEYNCRFGDPETQSLLPLLGGDVLAVLAAAAAGALDGADVEPAADVAAAVTVVLAGGGYPAHGDTGSPITGIEAAEASGALVFHAGTALRDGAIVTNGGRILNVTATGRNIAAARAAAYAAADLITWDGVRRREDIALAAALPPRRPAEAGRPRAKRLRGSL
jgi:phosphoribosylamine--glycine ligase